MSLGSLIQGAIGNPFGSLVSGTAFGVINDVLGGYRSKRWYTQDQHVTRLLYYHPQVVEIITTHWNYGRKSKC